MLKGGLGMRNRMYNIMKAWMKRTEPKTNDGKKVKGFTLVELIVVLVILAILAATLIPALTGYIDKANEKSGISECRSCVMAAQTLATEEYAKGNKPTTLDSDAILKLADITGGTATVTLVNGKVTKMVYVSSKSITVTYTAGAADPYVVGASAPAGT